MLGICVCHLDIVEDLNVDSVVGKNGHIVFVDENLKPFSSRHLPNLLRECCNFLSIDGI